MWILFILALMVLALLAFLMIRRHKQPQITAEDLLLKVFGNNKIVKTESESGGAFYTKPIAFDALQHEALSNEDRRLLLSTFGQAFTIEYSGFVDLGLAYPPTLRATVTNESGRTTVNLW